LFPISAIAACSSAPLPSTCGAALFESRSIDPCTVEFTAVDYSVTRRRSIIDGSIG
jgi:hypothetical protein